MSTMVRRLTATALHGRVDIEHEFVPGINILYGKNGSGKTTALHILANALNGDWARFVHLDFREIVIDLDDATLRICRDLLDGDEVLIVTMDRPQIEEVWTLTELRKLERPTDDPRESSKKLGKPVLSSAYFPAFRTMIEAWTSAIEREGVPRPIYRESTQGRALVRGLRAQSTHFARELFGRFVPDLEFPSPMDIQFMLSTEFRGAALHLAQSDRELLMKAFLDVFVAISNPSNLGTLDESVSDSAEIILDEIRSLSTRFTDLSITESRKALPHSFPDPESGVYQQLRTLVQSLRVQTPAEHFSVPVLKVYRDLLRDRVSQQTILFHGINNYLAAANHFLEDKSIVVSFDESSPRQQSMVRLLFTDGATSHGLRALSSGERQVISLIYAATHMSGQQLVLIDEPEISLHVDWQRRLLKSMSDQLQDRQIIAATHSPVIGADYEERMKELTSKSTRSVACIDREPTEDEEELG